MVVRIKEGGTGQVTAPGARIALGLSDQNIKDIVASGGPPGPYQPQDSDLTAIAALTTTGYGRGFLTQADSPAALTYIGAQPLDSDLTAIAALTTTAYGRGLLTLTNNAALVSELSGSFLSLSGGTLTGNLLINGANAASKFVGFTTANSSRWLISSDNATESGANVGSDFAVYRYSDTGVFLGQPLYIQRSTGNIFFSNTAFFSGLLSLNSGQIQFPATQAASSNSNTLDDYEEGTFTPVLVGTTVAGTGTYSVQSGGYVKVGRLVHVMGRVTWSAHTGTGQMTISGLPFGFATYNSAVTLSISGITFPANSVVHGFGSGTALQLFTSVSDTGRIVLPMEAAGDIMFQITYQNSA